MESERDREFREYIDEYCNLSDEGVVIRLMERVEDSVGRGSSFQYKMNTMRDLLKECGVEGIPFRTGYRRDY